jgi:hypothetical protein
MIQRIEKSGDGKSDILWCDIAGNAAIWSMDGFTIVGYSGIGNVPDTTKVAAVGDFNGDGATDAVLRDTSGKIVIWLMDGPAVFDYKAVGNVADRIAQ